MSKKDMFLGMLLAGNGGGSAGETYQLLSYIQSNGTQAILLTNNLPSTASLEVEFEVIATADYKWIVGGEGASGTYFGVQASNSSANRISLYKNAEKKFGNLASRMNNPICCTMNGADAVVSWPVKANTYDTISGSINSTFEVLSGFYAFGIGRINVDSDVSSMIAAKLRYLRIDDELYLPAKRISDGALGLLNTATHEFLTDSLNGDPFVAGDVVGTI